MRRELTARTRSTGFTLVELTLVIVIGGIMAAALTTFMRPAFDGYLDTRSRAELAAIAANALRRMQQDVRTAVPNSIRTPGEQCFETIPTIAGGRLRKGPDTINDSGPGCTPSAKCSAPFDPSQAVSSFDALTSLQALPSNGDFVVVDNQNPGDVYAGTNRVAIKFMDVPTAVYGKHRINFPSTSFAPGYDGGRFVIVPAAQQAVFYTCAGADGKLDADGNGRGTLWRRQAYGFNAAYPAACPDAGGDILATSVKSCRFLYDPNKGATQQNGFLSMQIELARRGETASLIVGAHVLNVP